MVNLTFLKNLLFFGALEIGFFLLKMLFSFLMASSSEKLEEKSSTITGKTSGFFLFSSLLTQFLLTVFTNLIPSTVLLFVLIKWEKVFAVALMITISFCLFLSFICFYSTASSMIDDGYKHIPAFLFTSLVIQYISDWLILFSSHVITTAFNVEDIVRSAIHVGLFSISLISNIVYFVIYIRKK